MIKWIAFDADDTLWENEEHYIETIKKLGNIVKPFLNGANVESVLYQVETRNIPIYGYGAKSFGLSMLEMAIEQSQGKITIPEINQIMNLIREITLAPTNILPGVVDTLNSLKGKYPLFIITKGDNLDQERKLKNSKLAPYFEFMEVVSEKNNAIYIHLLERYQIPIENFLMVGNSLKSDVLPVSAIGGTGVHLLNRNTWEHEKVDTEQAFLPPYHTISNIMELPALIEKINQGKTPTVF